MKSFIRIFALFVISINFWITPQTITAQGVSVSFQVFYDDLSPYGTWVDSPEYGYVWLPGVEVGFTPYGTNGYWVLTDAGWTWVSYYSWGWAPFHYGRWYTDPMYGPMWVPGNEWGPGWVTWRESEGYYGWAPIGPGISIEIAYSNNYYVPNDHWRFVRGSDFGREHINNYYVDQSTNVTIINNSTVINNNYVDGKRGGKYNAGPARKEVEKNAGRAFTPVDIKESSKPGQKMGKGELQLYRPQVQKSNSTEKKEAPAKVISRKDLKAVPAQKKDQPAKQQQQKTKPDRQQPIQQKNDNQVPKQQPEQQQQKTKPDRQQPVQPKPDRQQPKQQTEQKQQKTQPDRQQQVQPKDNNQQPRKQSNQPQQKKQQQVQPKNNNEPNKEQPRPQQPNSPQNEDRQKRPH